MRLLIQTINFMMTLSSEVEMDLIQQREIKGKYQEHNEQKLNGVHYTPTALAEFVADRILASFDLDSKKKVTIFDPAIGDGELLKNLALKILKKGIPIKICGTDIDSKAIQIAKKRLQEDLPKNADIEFQQQDFTTLKSEEKFDLIIANPPYVRTQSLGAKNTNKLSEQYDLEGRIDLYYAFLMGIQKFMHEGSVAGFIVSNRFMSTKSGAAVRKGLLDSYSFKEIYDLGDTKIFEAAVLPAVLVFKTKSTQENQPTFSSIYLVKSDGKLKQGKTIFNALSDGNGIYQVGEQFYEVKSGLLRSEEDTRKVWSISNSTTDKWADTVSQNTFCSFGDIGKIRVGVKTTADKVFINKDWNAIPQEIRPEKKVLKKLITHHYADRFKETVGNTREILYTHQSINNKKVAIDFEQYPHAWAYLNSHKDQLAGREYLVEAGRNWFEIWVPQEPSLWGKSKIVFRDICERPTFWLDRSGAIVNGDCYWLTLNEDQNEDDLWLLLAIANSKFIEDFYDHKFNNKLYSGRRRFMTQYVEQFPIPKVSRVEKERIISLVKEIYELKPSNTENLEQKMDKLIYKAFGV